VSTAGPASRFPLLFSPGRLGARILRNRILMAPMEKNLATADGAVTQRYLDYCEARAAGGAALIRLESTYVHPVGRNHRYQLGLHDDGLIGGYRRLADLCHRHGALVSVELQFAGRQTSSVVTGFQPVAPSAVPCTVLAGGEMPRPLELGEIRQVVSAFGAAARRAVQAGIDIVEIHGAHGYLVGQFLSPYANRRDDAYGGDFPRRLRFPLEVIAAVRETIGPGVPLVYRLSADEHVPGGLTLGDLCRIAPHLEAAGVDLLDVSSGIYESAVWIAQPMEMPPGCLAAASRAIRGVVRAPVAVAGRINDPIVAERILAAGDADFVTLGRALHADPELPRKAQEGRLDEICACVACQKCSDLLGQDTPVLCLVNTAAAREREYAIRRAPGPRRIVVAGGGPAGLESARVLALRGHRVTLLERGPAPGGQLLLARAIPLREELAGLVTYLEGALRRAGGEIRAGVEATPELVLAAEPDLVVAATGARVGVPPIPGILDSAAVDPFEVLRRRRAGTRRALVLGGGMLGVGLAHALAEDGAEVVVVEAGEVLSAELGLRPRWQYVESLRARSNVTIHTGTTVERLSADGAWLRRHGDELELRGIDLVLPTWPRLAASDLADALRRLAGSPPVFEIGDCAMPRTAFEAMQEAAALGHRL
jgi:2,4-dienoyl-CoA reductase-like NADH-dependent reductase (Old Yellow Enzyme family)